MSTAKMAALDGRASGLRDYLEGDNRDLKQRFKAHIDGNSLFTLRFVDNYFKADISVN